MILKKGNIIKEFELLRVVMIISHLFEEFGENCVHHLRGMFAFAIWDDRQKLLFIARDRIGIKPLYYYQSTKGLVFGSEMKAVLAASGVEKVVSPELIDRFLTYRYLPGNETLLHNVRKLAPGSYMIARGGNVEVKEYWDLKFEPSGLSLRDAEVRLAELLEETVKLHMISDVPVGFLLSGGLDSSALLSIATQLGGHSFSSFTVGFENSGIPDERPFARLAANRFGSKHYEMTITASEFEEYVPKYVWDIEELVCEPPAIAMYYVTRLARETVKVLVSGEGGDEAFGGYQTYRGRLWTNRLKRALGPFGGIVSTGLSGFGRAFHSARLAKYAPMLGMPSEQSYYGGLTNPFPYFGCVARSLYSKEFRRQLTDNDPMRVLGRHLGRAPNDYVNNMLYIDTKTWLPDDLLVKADKISMANSIELRVPFLDHKLLEFSASLPGNYKVRGLRTKYLAKRVLQHHVPPEILNRKKVGFPVPYESWFRQEMSSWLKGILLDSKSIGRGYFERNRVESLIVDNQRSGSHSSLLFSLAILELWHRLFLSGRDSATERPVDINSRMFRGRQ